MRLLSLDDQIVDLILVQQKQLGVYSNLQIDMCGIIDRSVARKTSNLMSLKRLHVSFRAWAATTKNREAQITTYE